MRSYLDPTSPLEADANASPPTLVCRAAAELPAVSQAGFLDDIVFQIAIVIGFDMPKSKR